MPLGSLLVADAVGDVAVSPVPFPWALAGSKALPGPWHLHRLRPCRAAPASRHGGNLQDLAVLRASFSIWPWRCPPTSLPSLPVPSLPASPGSSRQPPSR